MNMNFEDIIKDEIRGKKVLDCGAIGSGDIDHRSKYWAHNTLKKYAAEVLGVDIDKDAVERLRREGYNIIEGDCERLEVDFKPDVIFAAELIEHLANPGKFVERASKMLDKGGKLIITTPNQFSFIRAIAAYLGKLNEHREHVLVHNEKTITHLLERYGFRVKKIKYYTARTFLRNGKYKLIRQIIAPIYHLITWIIPKAHLQMYVVAEKL